MKLCPNCLGMGGEHQGEFCLQAKSITSTAEAQAFLKGVFSPSNTKSTREKLDEAIRIITRLIS